jgi:hypothetical protein
MKIFLSDLHWGDGKERMIVSFILFTSSLGQGQGRSTAGGRPCHDEGNCKSFLLGSLRNGGRIGEVDEANGASP